MTDPSFLHKLLENLTGESDTMVSRYCAWQSMCGKYVSECLQKLGQSYLTCCWPWVMYSVCPPASRSTDPKMDQQNSDGARTMDGLTSAMDGVLVILASFGYIVHSWPPQKCPGKVLDTLQWASCIYPGRVNAQHCSLTDAIEGISFDSLNRPIWGLCFIKMVTGRTSR